MWCKFFVNQSFLIIVNSKFLYSKMILGTFPKSFSHAATSQGNFPNMQFPKRQLPKPVLALALGPKPILAAALGPPSINLWYFKIKFLHLTEFIVWNIKGLRLVAKSLWQRLMNFFVLIFRFTFSPMGFEWVEICLQICIYLFFPTFRFIFNLSPVSFLF